MDISPLTRPICTLTVTGRSHIGSQECPTDENVTFLCGRLGWITWPHCSRSVCRARYGPGKVWAGQGMGRARYGPYTHTVTQGLTMTATQETAQEWHSLAVPVSLIVPVSRRSQWQLMAAPIRLIKTIIIGSIRTLNLNRLL